MPDSLGIIPGYLLSPSTCNKLLPNHLSSCIREYEHNSKISSRERTFREMFGLSFLLNQCSQICAAHRTQSSVVLVHLLSPMLKIFILWFCSNASKGHNPITKESLGLIAVVFIQTSLRIYTLGLKLSECCQNYSWRPLSTFCQWCVRYAINLSTEMRWNLIVPLHKPHSCTLLQQTLSNQFCPGPGTIHCT